MIPRRSRSSARFTAYRASESGSVIEVRAFEKASSAMMRLAGDSADASRGVIEAAGADAVSSAPAPPVSPPPVACTRPGWMCCWSRPGPASRRPTAPWSIASPSIWAGCFIFRRSATPGQAAEQYGSRSPTPRQLARPVAQPRLPARGASRLPPGLAALGRGHPRSLPSGPRPPHADFVPRRCVLAPDDRCHLRNGAPLSASSPPRLGRRRGCSNR